ncbi:response regulator [Polyangium aurulentum]|uniref:response regulator n=1 Tax=Polyangium aurulentum TaxID=2567896 RepID=UPI0010AE6777|nr:response regulator [Polyangium aurulentum]UQA61477.1 response regulator [Polyangium aurulentum]
MGAQATVLAEARGTAVKNERLGGVRADFVATLGRRVVELKSALSGLAADPASPVRRDDLRRRVHALAAAARLLRFNKLAEELVAGEAAVDRIAERGKLTEDDTKGLREMLDRLPELAWGEAALIEPERPEAMPRSAGSPRTLPSLERPVRPGEAADGSPAPTPSVPQTVLVVAPAAVAQGLAGESPEGAVSPYEVEHIEDEGVVPDLARALAPDVIVIDADRPSARDLVATLLADPLTEEVPIILLGRFKKPDDAALYVALGVARTLPKPVSPDALRKACAEVAATYVRRDIVRAPIGGVTLDQLGARLAEELRRGLCDAADARARSTRIELGEGSEVLGALWGAVARIRDVVTIESRGKVRFSPSGPEGAMPLAPWIGGPDQVGKAGRARAFGEARGAKTPSLDGLDVLVADDDAAVTWFLAGVLRAAGARVHEAHDGLRALEIACEVSPDLVISDIVMPGLDGFALCRAIKRDFALRDVPVVLLSWKEDLLQRVRELGAGADGYLRKEASALSIVHRLREILRPRLRVAERLAGGGEVRGRIDGLTPRTLLSLACTHRPSSTLTVRDALYLYEVEIREGRPVRATRTTADGSFERGPGVLARLLGVGSGRFVVAPVSEEDSGRLASGRSDLSGTLAEQLIAPIAVARAAQRLLSGASLISVERVEIDIAALGPTADATPEPARTLLRSVAAGASPRALLVSGKAAPHLVEDVLCDAAAHGAITAVLGEGGVDLLTPATQHETDRLRGVRRLPPPVELPPLSALLPEPAPSTPQPISEVIDRSAHPAPVALREELSPSGSFTDDLFAEDALLEDEAILPSEPTLDVRPQPQLVPARKLELSPPPPRIEPPVVAPPALALAPASHAQPLPPPPALRPTTLGSLVPPPVAEVPLSPPPRAALPSAHAPGRSHHELDADTTSSLRRLRRSTTASQGPDSSAPTRREGSGSKLSMWILFAVAGSVFAVGSRLSQQRAAAPVPPPQPAAVEAPAVVEAPPQAAAPAPSVEPAVLRDRKAGDTVDFPVMPQDLALRPEDKVPAGQGLLEIIAGPSDEIFVDGQLAGNGPVVKAPYAPKRDPYEIRVRLRGEERVRFALVKEGRLTRLRVAPPWSR